MWNIFYFLIFPLFQSFQRPFLLTTTGPTWHWVHQNKLSMVLKLWIWVYCVRLKQLWGNWERPGGGPGAFQLTSPGLLKCLLKHVELADRYLLLNVHLTPCHLQNGAFLEANNMDRKAEGGMGCLRGGSQQKRQMVWANLFLAFNRQCVPYHSA